jgi:heme-degrading monooxygenase HmoA
MAGMPWFFAARLIDFARSKRGTRMTSSEQSIYAATPKPPYYAVIFTALPTKDDAGYGDLSNELHRLAEQQPGYLGIEAAGVTKEITVSYWRDREAIIAWKQKVEHLAAQRLGRERWYQSYRVRVALVEREYGWER